MSRFSDELRYRASSFFTNWREFEGPFWTKVWLTLRNRTRSIVTFKGCCGHAGQPGC